MKKTDAQAFGSEYAMSAGDNAASRKEINASIVSEDVANEHSFRNACMEGLNNISGSERVNKDKAEQDARSEG